MNERIVIWNMTSLFSKELYNIQKRKVGNMKNITIYHYRIAIYQYFDC